MQRTRNGRCSQGQGIDILLNGLQLVFYSYPEFLFFIHYQQSKILEFNCFVHQLMGSNDYIHLSILQLLQRGFSFLCGPKTVQVIDSYWKIFQAFGKSLVMLKSQNGRRHQHCYLFSVIHSFKRGSYRNFSLSEANVPTHEAIHWAFVLHVGFDIRGRCTLVGRIFIKERSFQLMLQIGIGTISKTFLQPSLSVKFNEVKSNVLDPRLGFLFQVFPGVAAQFIDLRWFAVLAVVF